MIRLWPALLALVGCSTEPVSTEPTDVACTYPDAPDTMASGEALPAFSWPSALHADGRSQALDLSGVPCPDGEIDWSPFDVLLFVSIPAW